LDFQKGLKDWIILDTLMNKLQLGSIPKTNCAMQKWQQPENLSNFIKVTVSYGMNPVNLFEADKLSESGNLMQKGLKDWIILDTLMNTLQLGSIPKTNCATQKWQQPENLSNFIKVTVSYGMNPVNLFEAD
ncbi:hypothetical protein Celaphus_00010793, partial [Cervus elaphus hippelaphus]